MNASGFDDIRALYAIAAFDASQPVVGSAGFLSSKQWRRSSIVLGNISIREPCRRPNDYVRMHHDLNIFVNIDLVDFLITSRWSPIERVAASPPAPLMDSTSIDDLVEREEGLMELCISEVLVWLPAPPMPK